MIFFTILEFQTGKILRSGYSIDPNNDQILEDGEVMIVGVAADPAKYHVSSDGIVAIPDSPNDYSEWNGEEWVDIRSDATKQAELYKARNSAFLDKSDLLTRMFMAGILSAEDAELAAGGGIPTVIQSALETLPADAQMVARIKWRTDTVISRVHPVILMAAHVLDISDEQLDEIFDVVYGT